MKPKSFALEKGKYTVVATYTNHNDTTSADDEGTTKTHERPRPKLYDEMATLSLYAREYWGLGELPLRVAKISFSENPTGRFATLSLETVDGADKALKIGPLKIKREIEVLAGTNDRNPESKKNPLLDQIDLVENKISEYLKGDREQPELPATEESSKATRKKGILGLFGAKE